MILAEPGATRWDLKWSMFGIPCRVHPLFWLTTLFLSYNYDPTNPSKSIPFGFMAVTVACIFVSILVHEYGHAFAGRYYGDKGNYTVLTAMGGLCVPSIATERMPRIIELLWGPGAGFILAAVATSLYFLTHYGIVQIGNDYVWVAIVTLMYINILWGVLNLFPVFPLDGGQILVELVRWKAPHRGDAFSFTISMYAAIALAVLAFLLAVYRSIRGDQDFRSMMPVVLFGILAYQSYQARQHIIMYGGMEGMAPERREAWEQDPDWWKRGGR